MNDIRNSFINYQQQYLQEKIFVHTDKSFYLAGEIIWFKLYNVESAYHQLLDISKVAYVEVLDKNQKAVLQAKIALKHGLGSGSFYLPFSSSSGNYKLRAYTSLMKNFGPENFFEKDITIVNSTKKLLLRPQQDSTQYDIRFFPEGGNLVYGIESKLAFKAIDRFGKSFYFEGMLVDQQNDTIAKFHPLKFGMGNFIFTPSKGNKYKAIIKTPDGKSSSVDLPDVYDKGFVMKVENADNNRIAIAVRASSEFINQPCFLFVHSKKNIKAAQMQYLSDGKANFMIAKDSLDEGISYFTLFNENKQPVCERIFFKRLWPKLIIEADADKPEYGIRKKVEMDISANDNSGNSAAANMSLSVYKLDSLQTSDENNIITYLGMTSDLQGRIESPEYYLSNEPGADEATDNLMLTQGWRRFHWEEALKNKSPLFEFAPENEGHIILGKVGNKISGSPVEGIATYLSVPAKKFLLGCAVSGEEGLLKFDMKDFFGANEIAVQMANQSDSNYRIDILSPFSEKPSFGKIPEFNPGMDISESLLSSGIHAQVQNVYTGPSLQRFYAFETPDTTAFYGKPDQKYFLDDYTRFATMEEVMREYVADITVRKHEGHFRYRVYNYPYKLFFDIDPLVLMDGVPVSDVNKIMAFDPLKVKKIELMNRKYFLGPMVVDGIISYSTYNGDLAGFQLDPNVFILKYDGLQLQREFYSPVYNTKEQIESRLPDFRDLLFWSPEINTDGHGKKHISFYTSDATGKYIGVLQGISDDGKAGFKSFYFTVGK